MPSRLDCPLPAHRQEDEPHYVFRRDFADAKEDLAEASTTLKKFTNMPERQIPPEVLQRAKGFAVFHIVDVALLASGKGGCPPGHR